MKRPRTPPPVQEAEEAVSWEGPHHGLDGASAWAPHLRLRSGAGTLHPWATSTQGLRALVLIITPVSLLSLLGVDAQTVVQEPALSVPTGGTVTLTCGLSSGSVTSSNYPSWFQQTPGQAPRTVIYSTNSRPSGIPARFSGSISGNKAALTITGAQPEDEAVYYCSLYASSNNNTTGMQPHGEALPKPALVLRGLSALRRERQREGGNAQQPVGKGLWGPISFQRFMAPCLLLSLL